MFSSLVSLYLVLTTNTLFKANHVIFLARKSKQIILRLVSNLLFQFTMNVRMIRLIFLQALPSPSSVTLPLNLPSQDADEPATATSRKSETRRSSLAANQVSKVKKLFSSSLMPSQNKLQLLILATLCSLVQYL
jgi:hypothetical protein